MLKCSDCKKLFDAPRTLPQNSALHRWCEQVAEELNASGQPVQLVLQKTIDLDWDKYSVKNLLWRNIQRALVRKESTTQLKKHEEINKIYEHLNRFLGEKCGIHVPWPAKCNKCKHIDCVCNEEKIYEKQN